MAAKLWGLRNSRNTTSLNSGFTTVNTLKVYVFFFSSRRRHTRSLCDWSSDVCSSDLGWHVSTWPTTLSVIHPLQNGTDRAKANLPAPVGKVLTCQPPEGTVSHMSVRWAPIPPPTSIPTTPPMPAPSATTSAPISSLPLRQPSSLQARAPTSAPVPTPARNPTPTPTAICRLRPRLTSSPDIFARETVAVAPRPSGLRTTVSAAAVTTVPERRLLLPASSWVMRIRDPGTIADGSCDHATVGDSSKAIVPSQMRWRIGASGDWELVTNQPITKA